MKAYEHLIRYALANGATVSVWDGGGWDQNRAGIDNAHHLIAAIEAVDEAEITIRDKHDRRLGWARVSAYGLADDETVVDYTVNDFMNEWEAAYERDTATN